MRALKGPQPIINNFSKALTSPNIAMLITTIALGNGMTIGKRMTIELSTRLVATKCALCKKWM